MSLSTIHPASDTDAPEYDAELDSLPSAAFSAELDRIAEILVDGGASPMWVRGLYPPGADGAFPALADLADRMENAQWENALRLVWSA